ncbi:PREDICTED: SH3 domain-containing protein 1-like [Nelumbo nucifera]|uniref:SH3 domain-containing protein 1-like n=1 Tax=Nelumbo nucifera TaxID=4432 RepID=A0A1U7ZAJ9_NELNU|nr:PREDICTED: SH3 domain-containing protein 1-like [Nelumbo nucifera]
MEAIRKQASKLREQVAKQQQAVLKQLGHFGSETVMTDDDELQCHQQLQNLYNSTRAAKHFQRDLVRGVENFITTSLKQMEIGKKLAEDCCRYGNENQGSGFSLSRAALQFGTSHISIEKEREHLLEILGDQVSEPLRALITGAPLEDARHLTHRYERIRQEVEAQAVEVLRRRSRREGGASSDSDAKLQNAEAKLSELKSAMMALGKEATAAMSSVEAQQQQITFQKLLLMVDAEKSYHQSVAAILEKLHAEMVLEKQQSESAPPSPITDVYIPHAHGDTNTNESGVHAHEDKNTNGSGVRAHEDKNTNGSDACAHGDNNTNGSSAHAHGDRNTNGSGTHEHGDGKTNESGNVLPTAQNETFFIAKVRLTASIK